MKILVPTLSYPPFEGAASAVAWRVSRELAAMGHEVVVVAPSCPGFDALNQAKLLRIMWYPQGGWRLYRGLCAAWPEVKSSDLILGIEGVYGGLLGWLCARFHDKPYITFAQAHEIPVLPHQFPAWHGLPPWRALLRAIHSRAKAVIALNTVARDRLIALGVPSARIRVMPPAADIVAPWPPEAVAAIRHKFVLDTERVILAAGRFLWYEGQRTLVRAMPRVIRRFPDAQAVLTGRGPCLYDAIHEAHAAGVRDHVLFPGRLSGKDIEGLYEACAVFALPITADKRGREGECAPAFVQAHAHGKPVVAGRSPTVLDVVVDGENGLLVEPENPEALAEALIALLADPDRAQRLGQNGKQRVESELNWTRFAQRVLDAAAPGAAENSG